MLFLGLREAKWGIFGLFLWIIGCFIWIAWIYLANQQTTTGDYLKPGSIVVFAIIVIIIHLIPPTPMKRFQQKTSFKPFRNLIP